MEVVTGELTPEQRKLVADHMPYVRSLVYREWQQSDKELQADLVQQGYLALVDAATRYQPDRYPTTTFIGYAKWRVRKYIQEYVKLDNTIRPPWRIVKGTDKPEVVANQPLQGDDELGLSALDRYGYDEEGYERVEAIDLACWIRKVMQYYSAETQALYWQWKRDTIDWDDVTEDQRALLSMLDDEIREGT